MNPYNVTRIGYVSIFIPIFITSQSFGTVHYDDLSLKKCKGELSIPWSIHGWWPEYSHSKWPQFCDPSRYSEFNKEAIAPIKRLLEEYWYSCPGYPSAYNLWKHEWEKHGTCIPNVSVIDYFNHTINAFLQADANHYYNCCHSLDTECMLPFAMPLNETKWLGYCYKNLFKKD